MTCREPDCDRVVKARGICSLHYDRARHANALPPFLPTEYEIPPVCVCDVPAPDVIGECRHCRRPFKTVFAVQREAWRTYYLTRGWELNVAPLEAAA